MSRRLQLQTLLEEVLGSEKVYFQPPPNLQMKYPCIVYNLSTDRNNYADDRLYLHSREYNVTVIDSNPDSQIAEDMRDVIFSRFLRSYTEDNLHHQVFSVYY